MEIALLRLLAYMNYKGDEEKANKAVEWALKSETNKSPKKPRKASTTAYNEDVWAVYDAYPATDPNNNGRSTYKGEKNLKQIEELLKSGKTKEELLKAIEYATSGGQWLKNFETFLNNLPIVRTTPDIFTQEESIYQ